MTPAQAPQAHIEILQVGLQATVQDLGRPGFGHLGVPEAGAADRDSYRLGNRMVGNPESAAAIEILMGGFEAVFDRGRVVALAGAPGPAFLDRRPIPTNAWVYARPGQTLRTGSPTQGLRTYLAVAGGIDVPEVLGSRSTDTLSGMGPAPLRRGSVLAIGLSSGLAPVPSDLAVPRAVFNGPTVEVTIRLGPRDDLFPPEAKSALAAGPWHIGQEADRIGVRLLGPGLMALGIGQLATEGLAIGSVQVPPSGQPIIHLSNHPPTGGYPVIAVVDRSDVSRLAQAPPGTGIRFVLAPTPSFE